MLTPDEATTALREASRVRALGRRVLQGQSTRLPLVWWGLAWIVTYPAIQLLPLGPGLAVAAAAAVAAYALTRVGVRWDPAPGRTGWERQVARAWWAVVAGAFVVNLIAAPAPIQVFFLIPGALWGLALLLYAVVVGDVALGVLGGGIVVLAAALRTFLLGESLLLFGLLAGGWMAGTGLVRLLGSVGRR